jgi:hypothetical protein
MFASLLLHCIIMLTFKELVLLPFIQTPPGQVSLLQDVRTKFAKIFLTFIQHEET